MTCDYDGFNIESFEAGAGLWHARIRRADQKPVVIDGVVFSSLEVGFAWSNPDAAVTDAKFKSTTSSDDARPSGRHCKRSYRRLNLIQRGVLPMSIQSESQPTKPPPAQVRSDCPDCDARLAILRVIAGKAGSEYWTMRCTRCGGVHLDIVKPSRAPASVIRLT